jgi:hypothetical protein
MKNWRQKYFSRSKTQHIDEKIEIKRFSSMKSIHIQLKNILFAINHDPRRFERNLSHQAGSNCEGFIR